MERLRTLAILASLGAGSPAAAGAAADPSPPTPIQAPANSPAVRPEPPAAPGKYLEVGALLFNRKRYELAAKYLEAAQMYRDRLTPNEQVVLDEYRDHLDRYVQDQAQSAAAVAAGPRVADPAVTTASIAAPRALDMSGKPPAAADVPPLKLATAGGTDSLRGTPDVKQDARWMLQQAREQVVRKQFEAAEKLVAEVRSMNVKWGYFDDSPDKLTDAIKKARLATGTGPVTATGLPRDRRSARSRLREARAALTASEPDKAETIAREVRSWGLRYSPFDDTPEKVAAAVVEARRRAAVRDAELMVRSYSETAPGPRAEPAAPNADTPARP